MRTDPDHYIIIEPIDDIVKLEIRTIVNPIYIPEIGESFTYHDYTVEDDGSEKETIYKFTVYDRVHQVQVRYVPEQVITLKVKKID